MRLFRLTSAAHAQSLSGVGAARFGYRWNSEGVEMVYTAESRALALAEVVVHLSASMVPANMMMMEIRVPEGMSFGTVAIEALPECWNDFPYRNATKLIGDEFVRRGTHCLLRVPSAVVSGDYNYVINPLHEDFKSLTIEKVGPFRLDRRLLV